MVTLRLLHEARIAEEIYLLRVASDATQVRFNIGSIGVGQIGLVNGSVSKEFEFPKDAEFLVENWLMAPDGEQSFLFSREICGYAVRLVHSERRAERIGLPPDFEGTSGLCWFAPELNLKDFAGEYWSVARGRLRRGTGGLPQWLEQRRAAAATVANIGVVRVKYGPPGLYVSDDENIGFLHLASDDQIFAPRLPKLTDFALVEDRLIFSDGSRLMVMSGNNVKTVASWPLDETISALETVPFQGRLRLVAASVNNDSSGSVIRVFDALA